MFNFKDKTFVVLEFVTIDGYYSSIELKKEKTEIKLAFPTIIEIAAVKVKDNKIIGHYSTFVGIDGCNPYDIRLENDSPELNGITAEHLIGAPSLFDASDYLFNFISGCTVITKYSANDSRNPLHILKNYMSSAAYVFNNPVISITNIITAVKIKDSLSQIKDERNELDCYSLALEFENKENYADMVARYLDMDIDNARQDSLSRALIMARLFIELSKDTKQLEPIDDPAPF